MSTSKFEFEINIKDDKKPKSTLLLGLSDSGLAGLTASDYIVKNKESENIGYVSSPNFPGIAPFENGKPRHHTRVYNTEKISVLVNELFIPVGVSKNFVDSILKWTENKKIEEIVILHGIPVPHGPEQHDVFYVSSPEFSEKRLENIDVQSLGGGFLDGVPGDLLIRNIENKGPRVGVFITPSHPPGPDLEASMLLLDTLEKVYNIEVSKKELEEIAENLKEYYSNLEDRLNKLKEQQSTIEGRYPKDRAYI